jgi:hypothetical protein
MTVWEFRQQIESATDVKWLIIAAGVAMLAFWWGTSR